MSRIAVQTTRRLKELFAGNGGLNAAIGEIALEAGVEIPTDCSFQVMECNISADVSEKTGFGQGATLMLYCERIENRLREKFRRFSGSLHMVVEIRLSQDRPDWINPLLQVHVDGVIAVLDANRGCWGQGMHFGGGYEVVYGPIRQGGRRVNQSAKISFAVETSVE